MITVTRKFNFCYGHCLPEYPGKCAQQHGHNADLEVTIKGPPEYEYLRRSGYMSTEKSYPTMVEDFSGIKSVVEREVVKELDHKNLTDVFDPLPPTAEVIALWIFYQLSKAYGPNLMRIRLTEGPNSWTTVERGPKTEAKIYKYFKGGKGENT